MNMNKIMMILIVVWIMGWSFTHNIVASAENQPIDSYKSVEEYFAGEQLELESIGLQLMELKTPGKVTILKNYKDNGDIECWKNEAAVEEVRKNDELFEKILRQFSLSEFGVLTISKEEGKISFELSSNTNKFYRLVFYTDATKFDADRGEKLTDNWKIIIHSLT